VLQLDIVRTLPVVGDGWVLVFVHEHVLGHGDAADRLDVALHVLAHADLGADLAALEGALDLDDGATAPGYGLAWLIMVLSAMMAVTAALPSLALPPGSRPRTSRWMLPTRVILSSSGGGDAGLPPS
jgi:hypothetical protein